jgi:hypothetical protein
MLGEAICVPRAEGLTEPAVGTGCEWATGLRGGNLDDTGGDV